MRCFCASLHRRRGESTVCDPAPNLCVASVICDRVADRLGQEPPALLPCSRTVISTLRSASAISCQPWALSRRPFAEPTVKLVQRLACLVSVDFEQFLEQLRADSPRVWTQPMKGHSEIHEFLCCHCEPRRVYRRLQLLRGLEHEQIKSIFPRG